MPDDMRTQVEHSLISLGRRIPPSKISKFKQKQLGLKPNYPNLKGRAGWDSKIKVIPGYKDKAKTQPTQAQGTSSTPAQAPSNPICLLCPACDASELSSNKAFQLQDLDKTCKCKTCLKNVKAKDWVCMCHLPWHLCNTHSCTAPKAKSKNVPRSNSCKPNKRTFGPYTHEQLVAIDTKRARHSPPSILPPAPNILSVRLRERFAHLFRD